MSDRAVWTSIVRGLRLRCPSCGEGRLFRAYLKVNDSCAHCGEALHHQQADDAPPYLVILIVGHLVIPGAVAWQIAAEPSLWLYMSVIGALTVGLSLWLLPRMKGAVVGIQWANRMHGFGSPPDPSQRGETP
jgi:uncharacterized protein (DUF983 family)